MEPDETIAEQHVSFKQIKLSFRENCVKMHVTAYKMWLCLHMAALVVTNVPEAYSQTQKYTFQMSISNLFKVNAP